MGRGWDSSGIAYDPVMWAHVLRVLKPGGHLLAFSSARTYHRMACAIEDAGFEIRDQIMWVYGSGMPKSLNVSKAIDKSAGQTASGSWIKDNGREYVPQVTISATEAAQQWEGWGTALKPAHEPICMARKPFTSTVAANVQTHGTGAINIDGCRVGPGHDGGARDGEPSADRRYTSAGVTNFAVTPGPRGGDPLGRWPANLIHDGTVPFPDAKGQQGGLSGDEPSARGGAGLSGIYGAMDRGHGYVPRVESETSAARFFYCAKANRADRGENSHPTVKPTELMAYLCRLITPPGGLVLDHFMGSGSTGKACMREGFRFIGIDDQPEHIMIAADRIGQEWALRRR